MHLSLMSLTSSLGQYNFQLSCVALSWHVFVLQLLYILLRFLPESPEIFSHLVLPTAQTMTVATSAPIAGYIALSSFSSLNDLMISSFSNELICNVFMKHRCNKRLYGNPSCSASLLVFLNHNLKFLGLSPYFSCSSYYGFDLLSLFTCDGSIGVNFIFYLFLFSSKVISSFHIISFDISCGIFDSDRQSSIRYYHPHLL